MKNIVFTGHRDKLVEESYFDMARRTWRERVWVHGGAVGFDQQVQDYADYHGIETRVFRPDYEKWGRKLAPLLRNDDMLTLADQVIACYDGRRQGGTYYVVTRARRRGIPLWIWPPIGEEL